MTKFLATFDLPGAHAPEYHKAGLVMTSLGLKGALPSFDGDKLLTLPNTTYLGDVSDEHTVNTLCDRIMTELARAGIAPTRLLVVQVASYIHNEAKAKAG